MLLQNCTQVEVVATDLPLHLDSAKRLVGGPVVVRYYSHILDREVCEVPQGAEQYFLMTKLTNACLVKQLAEAS